MTVSDVIRKLKATYPNVVFKLEKGLVKDEVKLDIPQINSKFTLDQTSTWEKFEASFKAKLVNGNLDVECQICMKNNRENWIYSDCAKCGRAYCGECFLNSLKANRKYPPCPFCNHCRTDIPNLQEPTRENNIYYIKLYSYCYLNFNRNCPNGEEARKAFIKAHE